jgi:hypothetical protein
MAGWNQRRSCARTRTVIELAGQAFALFTGPQNFRDSPRTDSSQFEGTNKEFCFNSEAGPIHQPVGLIERNDKSSK